MELTEKHNDYEKYCREQLIGFRVDRVVYHQIPIGNPSDFVPHQTRFEDIHNIDMAIFICNDNKIIEINWDNRFHDFGVGVKITEAIPKYEANYIWEVSETKLWHDLIGQNISDIQIEWEHVYSIEQKTGKREDFNLPQVLILHFSDNRNIYISAAGFLNEDDDEVHGMLDNLTATDNEEIAKHVKMIR